MLAPSFRLPFRNYREVSLTSVLTAERPHSRLGRGLGPLIETEDDDDSR
jgi:hypothetical protein